MFYIILIFLISFLFLLSLKLVTKLIITKFDHKILLVIKITTKETNFYIGYLTNIDIYKK